MRERSASKYFVSFYIFVFLPWAIPFRGSGFFIFPAHAATLWVRGGRGETTSV